MKIFLKVCGALLYDLLSVSVLVYFAAFLPVILLDNSVAIKNLIIQLFIVFVAISYFFYCFKKGQTFGMQVWGLQLYSDNGKAVSNYQILIRILTANFSFFFFGIGYLFIFFNDENRSIHDIVSKTRLKQRATKFSGG